jgi:hypothetical protein
LKITFANVTDASKGKHHAALTASNGTAPLQSLQVSEAFTFWALG